MKIHRGLLRFALCIILSGLAVLAFALYGESTEADSPDTGAITGRIFLEDGFTPAVGAMVVANRIGGGYGKGVRSQDDGSYVLDELPEGEYRVCATLDGYVTTNYSGAIFDIDATPVNVTSPGTTPDINITLSPGGSISGHIYRGNGVLLLDGITVSANLIGAGYRSSAFSTSNGSYRIAGLPPGNYLVRVDVSSEITQYYLNADSIAAATEVTVTASQDMPGIDFCLGGSISGHVFQADGSTPIEGARVSIHSIGGSDYKTTETGSDGSYVLLPVPLGKYKIYAEASGFFREYYDNAAEESNATPVTVTQPGDTPGIDFTLDKGGSISGHIYQRDEKTPIPDAHVYICGTLSSGYGSGITSSDGSYTINGLRSGNYRVRAEATGYLEEYYNNVASCEDATPVAVTQSGDTPGIDFTLDKGGSISGHVYQEDGKTAIPGASVYAYGLNGLNGEGSEQSSSSSDGSYTINGLRSGNYRVHTEATGYFTEYYRDVAVYSAATPVVVTQPSDTSGIDFILEKGGSISGHIYQQDGKTAIPGARAGAYGLNGEGGGQCSASSDGSYTILGLHPGNYRVYASANGFPHKYFDNADDPDDAQPVIVVKSSETPGIDFSLDKGGSISGHALRADGLLPLPDIFIRAKNVNGDIEETKTLADGSYSISGLHSGNYRIYTGAPGYFNIYYNNSETATDATLVNVIRPGAIPNIDFVLDKGGSISGRVFQADGVSPVPGVHVHAIGINVTDDGSASTSSDGGYTISMLRSGSYRVYSHAEDLGYLMEYYNNAASSSTATPVSVTRPNNTPNIDFTLEAGGSISGYVYRADGFTPIKGAYVYASGMNDEGHGSDRTSADGSYIIELLRSGNYLVHAEERDYYPEYYDGAASSSEAMPVAVAQGDISPNINFTLDQSGSISGHIYKEDGVTPLSGASVYARIDDGSFYESDSTSSDGSYNITDLDSGSYRVYAQAEGYPRKYFPDADSVADSAPVQVTLNNATACIDLTLFPGGSISGHVYGSDGATPVLNACVHASGTNNESNGLVYTASDGSYSIAGLPSGNYLVYANKSDYYTEYHHEAESSSGATPVMVTQPHDSPNIDFTLDRYGSISGHIYKEDGVTPLSGALVYARMDNEPYYGSDSTSSDGTYNITGLYPGPYRVQVQAYGYLSEYFDNVRSLNGATTVTVARDQETTSIDFALDSGGSISGSVLKPDGSTPAADVYVYAQQIDPEYQSVTTGANAYSAEDGSYTISPLCPGAYVVSAYSQDYIEQYFNGQTEYSRATPVIVLDNMDSPSVDFVMDPGGCIAGHVYQADGETPIEHARINAIQYREGSIPGGKQYSTYSGADGSYILNTMVPGPYVLNASSGAYLGEYYSNTSISDEATPVIVSSFTTENNIDFTLDLGGTISGRVTQSDGVTPISAANISARLSGNYYIQEYTARSASDGRFQIRGLRDGEYAVSASASGYLSEHYQDKPDARLATPVAVTQAMDTPGIDFALEKGGLLSGHVYKDGGAKPFSGARVYAQLAGSTDSYDVSSGSGTDGHYTISGLRPGTYRVYAKAGDYLTEYYPDSYSSLDYSPVSVSLSSETTDIDFILDEGGSISGHVYQSDGETPVSGVQVFANTGGIPGEWNDAISAEDGSYTIKPLPPGEYIITAYIHDYAAEYYNNQEDSSLAIIVSVNNLENVPGIDFTLSGGGTISGHVYRTNGITPVYPASVSVSNRNSSSGGGMHFGSASAPVFADGSYSCRGLSPGQYTVHVEATGYASQYYSGTHDYSAVTLVAVASNQETPNVDFKMDTGGTITGHVYKSDGISPLRARISVLGVSNLEADTQEDGSYILTGVPDGNHLITAWANEYVGEFYQESYFRDQATRINIAGDESISNVDFILGKGGSISGRVYGPDGQSLVVSRFEIKVLPVMGDSMVINLNRPPSGITTGPGYYNINPLPPGKYKLQIKADGYFSRYSGGATTLEDAAVVTVTNGRETVGINFTLEEGGSISGHVYDEDGTPISGAMVTVLSHDPDGISVISKEDGSYTFSDLVPGDYRVLAKASTYLAMYYDGASSSSSATPVTVTGSGAATGVDFHLIKGGSISGHVYREDGITPLGGAEIFARVNPYPTGWSAVTASDGSYVITGLPPDNYKVAARATGYLRVYYNCTTDPDSATPLEVKLRETASGIDFIMDRGGSISGHIFEADGETPLAGISIGPRPLNPSAGLDCSDILSAADGSYNLTGLPPGDYQIIAHHTGYITEFYGGSYKQENAEVVVVTGKNNTPDINICLDRGGSITGYVFEADGQTPIKGISMILGDPGHVRDQEIMVDTNAAGYYSISDLPSGDYSLKAQPPQNLNYLGEYYNNIPSYSQSPLALIHVVAPNETAGINFNLETGTTISGRVYEYGSNNPLQLKNVHAVSVNSYSTGFAVTDAEGGYVINSLPSGTYLIYILTQNYVGPVLYYPGAEYQTGAALINTVAPQKTQGIDFVLKGESTGSISGHISQPEGFDYQFNVRAYSTGLQPFIRYGLSPDSQGNYSLTELPPGDYLVRVEGLDSDFYDVTPTSLAGLWYGDVYKKDVATLVTVSAGMNTPNIDFHLETGGTISGKITYPAGPFNQEARIAIFAIDSPDPYALAAVHGDTYAISGLPEGSYKVRVTSPGFASQWYGGADVKENGSIVIIRSTETIEDIDFILAADTTAPTVLSTLPQSKAQKVDVKSQVNVTFSEEMDEEETRDGFFISPPCAGRVEVNGASLTFKPQDQLAYSTQYTLYLSPRIEDAAGRDLGSSYTWNFTTEAWPTTVITKSSKALGDTSAKLTGRAVKPAGAADVQVYFEWGLTAQYGQATAPQSINSTEDFSAVLTGLAPGTKYHYRAVAKGDSTVYGRDKTFTTLPGARLHMLIRGKGAVTPEKGYHTYIRGSAVDIAAVPAEGWRFEKWLGDAADKYSASTTVIMNKSKSVTAVFSKIVYYDLTLAVKGQGTTDPAAGTHTYQKGTQIVIAATPAPGWRFKNWSGSASGSANPLTVTLKSDKKITANFIPAEISAIGAILAAPEQYRGFTVTLEGEYRGQEDGHGSPPLSKKDWLILDQSGVIWVHGGDSKFKPADVGKTVQLIGKVMLKNGLPYIQYSKAVLQPLQNPLSPVS